MEVSSHQNISRHKVTTLVDAFEMLGGFYVLFPLITVQKSAETIRGNMVGFLFLVTSNNVKNNPSRACKCY